MEILDGVDEIVDAVSKYNAILDDVIIPKVFHHLFEIKGEQKTEENEVVLLKEPKDAGYYEFSSLDDLVITNKDPYIKDEHKRKSFHADIYCFDSKPEKECFFQYLKSNKVDEVYFTGMFTAEQGELSIQYYDPESRRIRNYYPDFLVKMSDGSYQLIEVKGDNKIDDVVVKAKAEAAEEVATASSMTYKMYLGSELMTTEVLAEGYVTEMEKRIGERAQLIQSKLGE